MGRRDQYRCQGNCLVRLELEGEELTVTESRRGTRYRGRECPTACIRWKGRHRVQWGEENFFAEESMVLDAGPKLGVSFLVTRCLEIPVTQAERSAGREEIQEKMEDIFGRRCRWGGAESRSQESGVRGSAQPPRSARA